MPPVNRLAASALLAAVLVALGVASVPARSASPPRPPAGPITAIGAVHRAGAPAADPAGACRHPWDSPVDAAVVDPFRPPARPFGPGNRGLQYGTVPGQPVRAVDGGIVTFAGPVGGSPVLVIDHGGGLRSSSVTLIDLLVTRGQRVARGQEVATADTGYHLGARTGPHYLDPADLIERRCLAIRSLPVPPAR